MIKHSLSSVQFVDRYALIKSLCKGKRVLHLGATDSPVTMSAVASDRLLHLHLNRVADYVVGMDIDSDMIQWLSTNCGIHNIRRGNIECEADYPNEAFDWIIAGEIFEHLSNPGKALDCIRMAASPFTRCIITVPNAYSLKAFCRALLKHEFIHPDHTLHHSPHTLKTLLERHGFMPQTTFAYVNGGKGTLASIANLFLRANPQLAEGIGVICSLSN